MKHLITQPHAIFSVENSPYPEKVKNKISHEDAIKHLSSLGGGEVHSISGSYGNPEKSIFVSNPSDEQLQAIRQLAHQTGQESHIESTGQEHSMLYGHGPQAGKIVRGKGTVFHERAPKDYFSTLGEDVHFTHNFDFDKSEVEKSDKTDKYGLSTNQGRKIQYQNIKGVNKPVAMGTGEVGISSQGYTVRGAQATISPEGNRGQAFRQPQGGPNYDRQMARDKAKKVLQEIKSQPKPNLPKSEDMDKGARGDWKKEGYTLHFEDWNDDGQTPNFDPKFHDFKIVAKKNGKPVGYAAVNHMSQKAITPHDVRVDPKHRRKGLASAMYSHAEKISNKWMADTYDDQTKGAKALWSQPNRPFGKSDKIPGGLADKKTNKDFPKDRIKQGVKVEMEHTSDPKIAEEIARDHLQEDVNYYDKLKTIEKKPLDKARAYHGSKYDFENFDTKYSGSNQGNARGWGIYFSSKPEGASFYGKLGEKSNSGGVYEAKIPDAHEMAHWDLPISKQHPKVAEKLRQTHAYKSANERAAKEPGKYLSGEDLKGGEIYGGLQYYHGMSDKEASLYLNSLGVKGITYNHGKTQNHVVFDTSNTKILKRPIRKSEPIKTIEKSRTPTYPSMSRQFALIKDPKKDEAWFAHFKNPDGTYDIHHIEHTGGEIAKVTDVALGSKTKMPGKLIHDHEFLDYVGPRSVIRATFEYADPSGQTDLTSDINPYADPTPNYSQIIKPKKLANSEPLMKPYRSDAQRRWAHTPAGTKALGGKEAVRHWDKESKMTKALPLEELQAQGYKFRPYNNNPDYHVIRVFHGKKKVGHIAYRKQAHSNPNNPAYGYHPVNVGHLEPEHQGKGLYQHAIKMAGDHVKKLGSKGVYSEGYQRSKAATRAWDKVATHATPWTHNAKIARKPSAEDSDYFLAASELRKNKVASTFLAGLIGASSPQVSAQTSKPQAMAQQKPAHDPFHQRMLNTIAQVESSGGRQTAHVPLPKEGLHRGTRAFGKYGLTPIVIQETIKRSPNLSRNHPELGKLPIHQINEYMKKHPGLEDKIAGRHLTRLRQHFGDNPEKIGYAWLNGITGAKRAIKQNKPIQEHWHVKKIKGAFDKFGKDVKKSNYGPKQLGLYSQAENVRRKMSRTGEEAPIGPNTAVRLAGPTRNKQAEMQARIDKEKSRRNPVKVYSPEERKELASKRGLMAASEEEKGVHQPYIENSSRAGIESKRYSQDPVRNWAHKEYAKEQHKKVLSDLRAMPKPNLTKAAPSAPQVNLSPEHGKLLAQAHESAAHAPHDPKTKQAYGALIQETANQYKDLLKQGYKFSPIKPGQANPYKTSKDLHADLEQNKHMWYFPTEQGFGPEGSQASDHPLFADSGFKDRHGNKMMHNDVFRVVHDVQGHHFGGKTTFGPKGEMQAYLTHKKMFSPQAHPALAAETLLQNSAVNYGRHGEHNRKNPEKTIYAEQKAFAAPDWVVSGRWHE